MPTWFQFSLSLVFASSLFLMTGCSDAGPTRYRVSGTVTHDGKPVPKGAIYFEPASTSEMVAPSGFAKIIEGKFTTEASRGTGPGSYLVRIRGGDGVATPPDMNDPAGSETPFDIGKPIFAEYTTTVELPPEDSELSLEVPSDVDR
ncbi:hypothetical protein Pan216_02150 [Planctomycetes bacterium Pan216]|uniref:Carboxypeptidase regulatory-like domain-containing protein n=1 Tax=Kolteria novifilia TaxID=2527975 RepID=A0A518AXC9_9BACT|nr:hypothetical protein Pan216_02150 [Planctomycetes bacterium Pan216]